MTPLQKFLEKERKKDDAVRKFIDENKEQIKGRVYGLKDEIEKEKQKMLEFYRSIKDEDRKYLPNRGYPSDIPNIPACGIDDNKLVRSICENLPKEYSDSIIFFTSAPDLDERLFEDDDDEALFMLSFIFALKFTDDGDSIVVMFNKASHIDHICDVIDMAVTAGIIIL